MKTKTKNKHKKRALFFLFLTALLSFRLGTLLGFFSRFFVDMNAQAFLAKHRGVAFPPTLQMQLSFFQSWWYMHLLGVIIAIPITYWAAKHLQFTKPWQAAGFAVVVWFIIQALTHPPY